MRDHRVDTTWYVPTASGAERVAHLIPGGPHAAAGAVSKTVCGRRHRTWAVHDPAGDTPSCLDCRKRGLPPEPGPPVTAPPGTWWAPTSIHTHRKVRAHLLPDGATGGRGSALCGETRIGWVPVGADSMTHCNTCQVVGHGTGRRSATRSEARSAALVAASYCLDQDLDAEDLRELLGELLGALLDNPGEARRAS